MYGKSWGWAEFPADAVFSFYERQPALVGGVTIVVPGSRVVQVGGRPSAAPKEIEVWTSMDDVPDAFHQGDGRDGRDDSRRAHGHVPRPRGALREAARAVGRIAARARDRGGQGARGGARGLRAAVHPRARREASGRAVRAKQRNADSTGCSSRRSTGPAGQPGLLRLPRAGPGPDGPGRGAREELSRQHAGDARARRTSCARA